MLKYTIIMSHNKS